MSNQRLKKAIKFLSLQEKIKGRLASFPRFMRTRIVYSLQALTWLKTVKRNPQTDEPGKIIEQEASIHISNVMFFDKSGKPTRKRPSA